MPGSTEDFVFLDCTLRDGGYYTNWDFEEKFVEAYLRSMELAGVDVVELGLRSTPKSGYLGPFAYCSDVFLDTLPLNPEQTFGVMINATDFVGSEGAFKSSELLKLFQPRSQSKVSLVRIATDFKDVQVSMEMVRSLTELGYDVGLNLMKIGLKTDGEIRKALMVVNNAEVSPKVLYFADSLGNMKLHDVQRTIELLRSLWSSPLGIHAHNNMGQAIENSILSAKLGVSWIDGTVLGMGRGAGNAASEILLQEISSYSDERYRPEEIFKIVLDNFQPLQKAYGWGFNLLYYLSAKKGIHPTFVQNMVSDNLYDSSQIMTAIENLGNSSSQSFSEKKLEQAMLSNYSCQPIGTACLKNRFDGKDVLLLANGKQLGKHKRAVCEFIERRKPVVISLNINEYISSDYIDFYAVCNKTRLVTDLENLSLLNKPIFMPRGKIGNIIEKINRKNEIFDYGMLVGSKNLKAHESYCEVPADLVALYSIGIAVAGNAERVLFAGFDGYSENVKHHLEMDQALQHFRLEDPNLDLIALTKTTYSNLDHNSVYNPEV